MTKNNISRTDDRDSLKRIHVGPPESFYQNQKYRHQYKSNETVSCFLSLEFFWFNSFFHDPNLIVWDQFSQRGIIKFWMFGPRKDKNVCPQLTSESHFKNISFLYVPSSLDCLIRKRGKVKRPSRVFRGIKRELWEDKG